MTESKKFITPRGVAVFPKLNEPDTKFKTEGEYTVKLRLKEEQFDPKLLAALEAVRDAQVAETKADLTEKKQGAKLKSLKVRPVLTAETDKETGEETGFVLINCKMRASGISKKTGKPWSRKPDIFDSKGVLLKKVPAIWGGSELKVSVDARPYYTPSANEVGLSFALEGVQILKLVSGQERDASAYGFKAEEDGFDSAEFSSEETDASVDADVESGDDF